MNWPEEDTIIIDEDFSFGLEHFETRHRRFMIKKKMMKKSKKMATKKMPMKKKMK